MNHAMMGSPSSFNLKSFLAAPTLRTYICSNDFAAFD